MLLIGGEMKNIQRKNSSDEVSLFFAMAMCFTLLASIFITEPSGSKNVYQESFNYEQQQTQEKETETTVEEIPTVEVTLETSTAEPLVSETKPAEKPTQPATVAPKPAPPQQQGDCKVYTLPAYQGYTGFKTYERYTEIKTITSPHYRLQQEYAYTSESGLRMVNDRHCVAMGTHFNMSIGQYFTLVLANGTKIPCILGDIKANGHTDVNNIYTLHSKCCSEFIVDIDKLDSYVKIRGDVSYLCKEWQSPVIQVIVENYNVFSK